MRVGLSSFLMTADDHLSKFNYGPWDWIMCPQGGESDAPRKITLRGLATSHGEDNTGVPSPLPPKISRGPFEKFELPDSPSVISNLKLFFF
jgi:hypothetical protein